MGIFYVLFDFSSCIFSVMMTCSEFSYIVTSFHTGAHLVTTDNTYNKTDNSNSIHSCNKQFKWSPTLGIIYGHTSVRFVREGET